MDRNRVQESNAADADGMVAALELVITPTIFGFLGYLLDGALDTSPVFTVGFAAFTLTYSVWKLVVSYNVRMTAAQRQRETLRPGHADA